MIYHSYCAILPKYLSNEEVEYIHGYARSLPIQEGRLGTGVSDTEIEKKLYFIDELNTQNTLDNNQLNFLKDHHNIKDSEILEKKIKTSNLNNILNDYKFYNIDFMNLDIEGHELKVLETLDFNKINIRYLCIEMIEHNKESILNNKKIKDLLSKNNFKLIKNFDFNFIYKKEN